MSDDVLEGEVVEERGALAVREPQSAVAPAGLFATDDPVEVLEKATRVANALKGVVVSKRLVSNIKGKEFPLVEAWLTLAAMLNVHPVIEWTRKTSNGWEARCVVRNGVGLEIGAAEAECTRDESTWAKRDDYAIRSMAQTRATSKALSNKLRFIMVLAGYQGTPAEEMPRDEEPPKHEPAAAPEPPAIWGAKLCRRIGITDKERHAYITEHYGVDSFTKMEPEQIRETCKFFQDVKRKEREQHAS